MFPPMMPIAEGIHLPKYFSIVFNALAIWQVLKTLTVIMCSLISNTWEILNHSNHITMLVAQIRPCHYTITAGLCTKPLFVVSLFLLKCMMSYLS